MVGVCGDGSHTDGAPNFRFGLEFCDLLGCLETVHTRHVQVGEHQLVANIAAGLLHVGLEHGYLVSTVSGCVAVNIEHGLQDLLEG